MYFRAFFLSIIFLQTLLLKSIAFSSEEMRQQLSEALSKGLNIQGVEVVLAGRGTALYSRFGHALLRLVSKDDDPFNDYVISFEAVVPGKISYIKGIKGGYAFAVEVKSLDEIWREYASNENRIIERFIIPLTENDKQELLATLQQFLSDPSPLGKYKFFSRNCVTALLEVLESILNIDIPNMRMPLHISKALTKSWLKPYPSVAVNTIKKILEKLKAKIHSTSIETFEEVKIVEEEFSNKEIQMLVQETVNKTIMTKEIKDYFIQKYQDRFIDFDQLTNLSPLNPIFYTVCDNSICSEEIKRLKPLYWSLGEIVRNDFEMKQRLNKSTETVSVLRKHYEYSLGW